MIISGMMGLGDNIYQRAFIKNLKGDIYLETPWPELYNDLNVNPVKPKTTLRTQSKNIDKNTTWHTPPKPTHYQKISYGKDGIFAGMERAFGVSPLKMDLPDYDDSPVDGKYVVLRPVTVRAEWVAITRNPNEEYITLAAEILKKAGYKIVSVADIDGVAEWIVGDEPYSDIKFHKGELSLPQLMSLIQNAHAVVGGIGWIVPASIAYHVNAFIVCGGQGGYNSPNHLTHESMDLSRITFSVPDNFCTCTHKDHNCDKSISNFESSFTEWLLRAAAMG